LMPAKMIDRTGEVFGLWTVIKFDKKDHVSGFRWICRCLCGTERSVIYNSLAKGRSKSCGCQSVSAMVKSLTKHGMAGTKTYKSWHAMIQRSQGKGGHESYVDRGIDICPEWMMFENFLKDMGERPDGKTLDRIDNSKGYWPWNCRWATNEQQMNNRDNSRFVVVDGQKMTLPQVSKAYGVGLSKLRHCIRKGQSINEAMQDQRWKNRTPRKGYLKPDGTFVKVE
jgi:hypothetical protein